MRFLGWKQGEVGHESVLKCLRWPWWGVGGWGEREGPGRSHYVEKEGRREGTHVPVCAHMCVVCLHVPTHA